MHLVQKLGNGPRSKAWVHNQILLPDEAILLMRFRQEILPISTPSATTYRSPDERSVDFTGQSLEWNGRNDRESCERSWWFFVYLHITRWRRNWLWLGGCSDNTVGRRGSLESRWGPRGIQTVQIGWRERFSGRINSCFFLNDVLKISSACSVIAVAELNFRSVLGLVWNDYVYHICFDSN